MGGFPEDEARAFAVISWGTLVACLAGADKIIVKTPHEAMGIPSKEANAAGLRATRQIINMMADQGGLANDAVEREKAIIEREVRCILSKVCELGRGDVREGAAAAFEAGVLDVPFAPSVQCRGKVLPMRDNEGCIRIFNRGDGALGRGPGRFPPRTAGGAGAGRGAAGVVPDGDRRHLCHQQRAAGGEAPMKIRKALFAPGSSAFFFDDQRAIKQGARHDGFVYAAQPVTPGFTRVRMAGESISVLLVLEDGQIAVGDCAAVQYSGAGGRDPLFLAETYLPVLEAACAPASGRARGRTASATWPREFCELQFDGQPLHTGPALGHHPGAARRPGQGPPPAAREVICEEYGLPVTRDRRPDLRPDRRQPLRKRRQDDPQAGRRAAPRADQQRRREAGPRRREAARSTSAGSSDRIERLKPRDDYCPVLHIDVYGTVGLIFDQQARRVADYLAGLEADAGRTRCTSKARSTWRGSPARSRSLREITAATWSGRARP